MKGGEPFYLRRLADSHRLELRLIFFLLIQHLHASLYLGLGII